MALMFRHCFDTSFLGTKLYWCFRIHKLRLIKNLTPLRAFRVRKRVRTLKNKCAMLILLWRLIYSSRDLCLQLLLKYENNKGSLCSGNVSGLFLKCLVICRRPASFSLIPHKVISTLLRTFLCSLCEGFTKAPNSQLWIVLTWPSGLFMLLFLADIFPDLTLPWVYLTRASPSLLLH
jgi:hypothetical protein